MKRLLTIVFLLITTSLIAQTISGRIIDGNRNEPVDFENVQLLDSSGNCIEEQFSDFKGRFQFELNSPGCYSIKVNPIGSPDSTFQNIIVSHHTKLLLNVRGFCEFDKSKHNKRCPVCNKRNMSIPIVYGLHISIKHTRNNEEEKFLRGGCLISDCDPNWYCKRDQTKF